MAIDFFEFFSYRSDTQNANYQIVLHVSTAAILGIGPIPVGSLPPWPKKKRDLRYVTGEDDTGSVHRRLTVTDPAASLITTGGIHWTDKEGNTIIRTGVFMERFPQKG
jgi:hypothetical protein